MNVGFFTRLIAPVVMVSVLLLLVGVVAALQMHQSNQQISDALAQNLAAVFSAESLLLGVRDVRVELNRFAVTQDVNRLNRANANFGQLDLLTTRCRENCRSGDALEVVASIASRLPQLETRLNVLLQSQPIEKQVVLAQELVQEINLQLLPLAEQLLTIERRIATNDATRNLESADRVGLTLLLLGGCGAAAGTLAGFGIARGLHRSLAQLSEPIRDTAGKLNEVVDAIRLVPGADLPDLKLAMQRIAGETSTVVRRLQEAQQEAMKSEHLAAVGQLAAGLAHELRNPLTAMKILIQAGNESAAGKLERRDLAVLEEEIVRLEKLTQTFLDYARPLVAAKNPVEMQQLVVDTLEFMAARAQRQAISLNVDFDEHGPAAMVQGDAGQLRQVLINLLLNTFDVLPGGGNVTVQVTTKLESLDGGEAPWSVSAGTSPAVYVRVIDNGPGLPADLGSRIFDPFTSTKETGIGLGLSISQKIVRHHGGEIVARNRPEGGAEITLSLPRSEAARPLIAAVSPPEPPQAAMASLTP